MLVKELKEALGKHPDSAKVMITWEGIFINIRQKSIYLAPNGVLVIGADEDGKCWYKDDILSVKKIPR